MDRQAWVASSAVALIYVACAIAIFSDPAYRSDPVITRLALAVLFTVAISVAYFLGKLYCHQWQMLSGRSTLGTLVERVLVPLIPTMFVPGLAQAVQTKRWSVLVVSLVLLVAFMDLPRAYANVVGTWFAEPRFGDRFFYLQFPPKRRLDMLPMDLALAALLVYLFTRHFDWR